MKLLNITLLITIALIFASCHSHKQIVIVQPVNPHCACELEGHAHKDDDIGCPHHLPDVNPHCRCGEITPEHEDSSISPQDDNQSCGCAFRGADTRIKWEFGDVPREIWENALKDMHDLHLSYSVKTKGDDGAVSLPDDSKSCGCGVAGVQGIVNAPGVPIDVIKDAIREIPDTIAPQCRCGIDSTDEGDAGLSTEQQKAIIEQGFKLLEGDVNPQPEAGEDTIEESMRQLEHDQAEAELLLRQAEQEFEARKHEMTESEIQEVEAQLRIAKEALHYLKEQNDTFRKLVTE